MGEQKKELDASTKTCSTCSICGDVVDTNDLCSCPPETTDGTYVCPHCHKTVPMALYCIWCGEDLVYPLTHKKYEILKTINDLTNGKKIVSIQNIFDSIQDTANEVVRTYISQMLKMSLLAHATRGEYSLTKLGHLALRKTYIIDTKEQEKQEKLSELKNVTVPDRKRSNIITIAMARNIITRADPLPRIAYRASVAMSAILHEVGINIVKDGMVNGEVTPEAIKELAEKILIKFENKEPGEKR